MIDLYDGKLLPFIQAANPRASDNARVVSVGGVVGDPWATQRNSPKYDLPEGQALVLYTDGTETRAVVLRTADIRSTLKGSE